MARLQDFQTVTPAGSDNLLIVQSQGQGLSTLNAVGQKVANDTTMSSLTTTAKTIVSAINENSDYIKYLLMTEQSDLNSSLNNGTTTPRITYYASTASNRPSGNSGVVITQGNGTYRQQTAIDLEGNIFARYYNNGTISSWVAKSEKTDGFTVTPPTNVQLAVNKSHYISSKIVHILCQVKVTANLSNQPIITWTPTCDNAGITIPLFSGNGQWSPMNSIIYGYLGSNGINANASTTNAWVTIDQIIRLA